MINWNKLTCRINKELYFKSKYFNFILNIEFYEKIVEKKATDKSRYWSKISLKINKKVV